MQTLGLASEQKPSDGMLKRLFWPTIENQYDVDLIGAQGFWVCVCVGSFSLLMMIFVGVNSNPLGAAIVFALGLLTFGAYFLAGIGVRQRSLGAATLIFCCYLMDRVVSFELTGIGILGFPVIGLIALMLLFANVRGTILARKWRLEATHAGEDFPDLQTDIVADQLVNDMPAKVWPWGRFVFYPVAVMLLLYTVVTAVSIPMLQQRRARILERQQQEEIRATFPRSDQ